MIQFVTGKLGAGKTLYCSILMFDALCQGKTVVTNIKVNWPKMVQLARRMRRVELEERQLRLIDPETDRNWQRSIPFGARDAFVEVFLDEIHLFFNSRDWSTTATACRGLLSFLTQSRKAAVNITFIAQEESTVDKQMRVQAQYLVHVVNSKQIPLGALGVCPFNFFIAVTKDAQNGNVIRKDFRSYDKRFFGVYDSFSFLDSEMSELSEGAEHVTRIPLRKVHPVRWAFEPLTEFVTRLASLAVEPWRQFVSLVKA